MAIKAECLRKAGVINDQEKYWVDNRVCIFTRDAGLKMQPNSFFQNPLVAVILAAYRHSCAEDDPVYDPRNFYKANWYNHSASFVGCHHADLEGQIMKRFVVATLVGLTIAATLSTSASAFRCLATSSNGVNTWGYGIFFSRASHFAVRHCRVAGGVGCHVAYCR
jgi:hypothetical protein